MKCVFRITIEKMQNRPRWPVNCAQQLHPNFALVSKVFDALGDAVAYWISEMGSFFLLLMIYEKVLLIWIRKYILNSFDITDCKTISAWQLFCDVRNNSKIAKVIFSQWFLFAKTFQSTYHLTNTYSCSLAWHNTWHYSLSELIIDLTYNYANHMQTAISVPKPTPFTDLTHAADLDGKSCWKIVFDHNIFALELNFNLWWS